MSNLIPPLLSSSPPPIVGPLDEDDDDEFGDFRAANESYECDDLSLPDSPKKLPTKEVKTAFGCDLDINSNTNNQKIEEKIIKHEDVDDDSLVVENIEKDFQDRRKEEDHAIESENHVNCSSLLSNSEKDKELTPPQSISPTDCKVDDEEEVINPTEISGEIELNESIVIPPAIIENTKVDLHKSEEQTFFLDDSPEFCEMRPATPAENNCDSSEQEDESKSPSDFSPNEIESIEEPSKSEDLSELDQNLEIKYDESPPEYTKTEDLPAEIPQDDDFGDFENHFSTNLEQTETVDEQKDEFEDFVAATEAQNKVTEEEEPQKVDDFGDFDSSSVLETRPETENNDDDDFGDFGDFSTHTDSSSEPVDKISMLTADVKDAFAKSEVVLKDLFPEISEQVGDFRYIDDTQQNVIFTALKDVTETDALTYQWSKSTSQKLLLKALNIDLRNILYGPSWNSSMPRFAANLRSTPLEPIKSEILTPTPVQNVTSPSNSSQKSQLNGDVPQAQFDWSGSGLINPLDYSQTMLLDLEQLVASLDIPATNPNQTPSPSNELLLDDWDLWLQSTPSCVAVTEEPSQSDKNDVFLVPTKVIALEPEKDPISLEIFRQKDPDTDSVQNLDFSKTFESPKMIPLRETHISNDVLEEKPKWFESTILTPELPRKEAIANDGDDDFDDFQMVLPSKPNLTEFEVLPTPTIDKKVEVFQFGKSVDEDDDFSDFSSAQVTQPVVNNATVAPSLLQPTITTPLQPISLEPLKPSVQYQTPSQINWPDPGVTENDIRNIELTYSRNKIDSSNVKSVEDDEWSDFVSVKQVSVNVMPERTATPDLPLSVLNLNQIQPTKQPIPLITPGGLSVQTKLSSLPKSSNVTRQTNQSNLFRPPPTQFLPSLISQQFANPNSNHFQQFGGFCANNSGGFPNFLQSSSTAVTNNHQQNTPDDDDWSDFVSSQPVPNQNVNGFGQKSKVPQQVNWNSTNIITNPSHFDSLQSYVPQQSQQPIQQTKANSRSNNAVPSISSMPELDFIAPKNRTNKK